MLQFPHRAAQFHNLQILRTFHPVVQPAYDHITAIGIVAVFFEVAAQEFELNAHALPLSGLDLAHGLAVGKPGLQREHAARQDNVRTG